jgi:diguanylate cyclase (GGDEF)-like protein
MGKVMTKRDVDWRDRTVRLKREMAHHLTHDPVTGLPNRVLFYDRIDMALTHAERNKERLAVMLIDLDDFKNIVHNYGYDVGDSLLKEVGRSIRRRLRRGDTVARLGGDEFVLILPGVIRKANAQIVAQTLLDSFQESFLVKGVSLHTTPSIGIAMFPDHGHEGEELLRHADIAMYQAKERGKNTFQFFVYSPDMVTPGADR